VVEQIVKQKKTCFNNQHYFNPYMFDTFDFRAL